MTPNLGKKYKCSTDSFTTSPTTRPSYIYKDKGAPTWYHNLSSGLIEKFDKLPWAFTQQFLVS